MWIKFNIKLLRRLRDFVVIWNMSMILVYLMNFINNMKLYMKQFHYILLKLMVKREGKNITLIEPVVAIILNSDATFH